MVEQSAELYMAALSDFRLGALALQRTRPDERIMLSRRRTSVKSDAFAWLGRLRSNPVEVPLHTPTPDHLTYESSRRMLLGSYRADRAIVWSLRRARLRANAASAPITSDLIVDAWTRHWIDALWETRFEHPRTRGPVRRAARQSSMATLSALYLFYRADQNDMTDLYRFAVDSLPIV